MSLNLASDKTADGFYVANGLIGGGQVMLIVSIPSHF